MKKILIVLMLMMSSLTFSQGNYYVNVVQDVKLALIDDLHGNHAFTPDLVLEVELQDTARHNYYFSALFLAEYANLAGGEYYRYGFGLQTGFFGFDDRMEIGISPNFSNIYRFEKNNFALGVDFNFKWKLTKDIKFISKVQVLQRSDLEYKYGGSYVRTSWMMGLGIRVFKF